MIVYNLTCPKDHEFEAWFQDSDAFDAQAAQGAVQCPRCGSVEIRKALMAPRVARSKDKARSRPAPPPAPPVDAPMTAATARKAEFAKLLTELRQHVEKNCDYVGDKFAEEARRIHYGEADQRDIYGESTLAEARELLDEGIQVAPVPGLPKRDS